MSKQTLPQRLQQAIGNLSQEGQEALLEYAEYLVAKFPANKEISQVPQAVERPEDETVVLAIRRLSQTYPMLDSQALLHETSTFMMRHIMQGESANQIIDELELYFREQYEAHQRRREGAA